MRNHFIICALFLRAICPAQAPVDKIYSLQECIDLALKNNEHLKTAALGIQLQKQNSRDSGEIPKTNVVYTQGQFNSIYPYDENITVNQTIPFPTVFSNRKAQARTLIRSSEHLYEATKAELISNVKSSYYSLLYFNSVHELLKREDSIYTQFSKLVVEKFSLGKSSLLEKAAAETELIELRNSINESEEEINDHFLELQTYINIPGNFDIVYTDLKNNIITVSADTSETLSHPTLLHLKDMVKAGEQNVDVERSRAMPDISLSYFNQTIFGPANIYGEDYFLTKSNRLQGFIIGLAVPLWFHPLHSKIQTAKIHSKVAQSELDHQYLTMHGMYNRTVIQYLKHQKSLKYYKENVLDNSRSIVKQALEAYSKDEINYVDYIQILGHALKMERDYLELIQKNNMAALKIEYLQVK